MIVFRVMNSHEDHFDEGTWYPVGHGPFLATGVLVTSHQRSGFVFPDAQISLTAINVPEYDEAVYAVQSIAE